MAASSVVSSTVALMMILAAASMGGAAEALGINCRGSGRCGENPSNTMSTLRDQIVHNIDPNRFYRNGQKIACFKNICAFCQNSNGAPGHTIATLMPYLVDHGCTRCGSVPLFYPQGDNDVSHGELTVNFVTDTSNPCYNNGAGHPLLRSIVTLNWDLSRSWNIVLAGETSCPDDDSPDSCWRIRLVDVMSRSKLNKN